MESKATVEPKLSVIVPALLGYDSVLAALDAWKAQSSREQLEILVLCPDADKPRALPPGQKVLATGSMLLHQARAMAIRRARAPYVMIGEDHCLPDRFCAERMLDRIAEGWDGVFPVLRPGNPRTSVAQAAFVLTYGQWMAPVEAGPTVVLPGHNGAVRRSALLAMDAELEDGLRVAAFLVRRLGRQGYRFYLENRATMRHFDPPSWVRELKVFGSVGMGFGVVRTRAWPAVAWALYPLAAPAIAARHWWRAWTQYRRARSPAELSPLCMLAAGVLACAWAIGEGAGAWLGVERVTPMISVAEVKPVSRSEVECAAAYLSSK